MLAIFQIAGLAATAAVGVIITTLPDVSAPRKRKIMLHADWFLPDAVFYLLWAVLATHLFKQRYRTQLLAKCLSNFAIILRTQAVRFAQQPDRGLAGQNAATTSQSGRPPAKYPRPCAGPPTTAKRLRLTAMLIASLIALLEAREHQPACNLDLDFLLDQDARASTLPALVRRSVAAQPSQVRLVLAGAMARELRLAAARALDRRKTRVLVI